jgi:predicted anti-sigma-YlaC factor YlaD
VISRISGPVFRLTSGNPKESKMKKNRVDNHMGRIFVTGGLLFLSVFMTGCSINKAIMNGAGNALSSGGGTVFTSDDDIQLVGDALPFALKLYESILDGVPNHANLLMATGKLCIMYSFAYIQGPADLLPDSQIELQLEQLKRSKNLYLRGARYCMRSLEAKHKGFTNEFRGTNLAPYLDKTFVKKEDAQSLYWTGMAWMGAFTADKFDMNLSVNSGRAVKLINRALALDEAMDHGSIHEFFITYYGSLPASMGGSEAKAREHFKRAIELSRGLKAGPYLSLASSVSMNKQDKAEFTSLLEQAVAVDPDKDPANRLLNLISIKKAHWMLDHLDKFFVSE